MAQETEHVEVSTPAVGWDRIEAMCKGGVSIGELTVLIGKPGTGKSRITEYVIEQLQREHKHGV